MSVGSGTRVVGNVAAGAEVVGARPVTLPERRGVVVAGLSARLGSGVAPRFVTGWIAAPGGVAGAGVGPGPRVTVLGVVARRLVIDAAGPWDEKPRAQAGEVPTVVVAAGTAREGTSGVPVVVRVEAAAGARGPTVVVTVAPTEPAFPEVLGVLSVAVPLSCGCSSHFLASKASVSRSADHTRSRRRRRQSPPVSFSPPPSPRRLNETPPIDAEPN